MKLTRYLRYSRGNRLVPNRRLAGCSEGYSRRYLGGTRKVLSRDSVDTQGYSGCTLGYSLVYRRARAQLCALSATRGVYLRAVAHTHTHTRMPAHTPARISDLHLCRTPSVIGHIGASADGIVHTRMSCVSLGKCVRACECVRLRVGAFVSVCVSVLVCVCVSARARGCACACVRTYVRPRVSVHACLCVCASAFLPAVLHFRARACV